MTPEQQAEYDAEGIALYCGWDDRCIRCTNFGPMFAFPDDDKYQCAECIWEHGWTEGGPDPLEYRRAT